MRVLAGGVVVAVDGGAVDVDDGVGPVVRGALVGTGAVGDGAPPAAAEVGVVAVEAVVEVVVSDGSASDSVEVEPSVVVVVVVGLAADIDSSSSEADSVAGRSVVTCRETIDTPCHEMTRAMVATASQARA